MTKPPFTRTARALATVVLTFASLAVAPAPPVAADGVATRIADGKPWAMTMANGRSGKLTLNRDGTGRIGMGPFSMSATWQPTDDGLCIETSRMGRRCMSLVPTANGFAGKGADGGAVALTR